MQKIQLNNSSNIALKRVAYDSSAVGMLSRKFKHTLQQFLAEDKVYSFMRSIKKATTN